MAIQLNSPFHRALRQPHNPCPLGRRWSRHVLRSANNQNISIIMALECLFVAKGGKVYMQWVTPVAAVPPMSAFQLVSE